jgi:uncharacterized protein (TIGR03083 family)
VDECVEAFSLAGRATAALAGSPEVAAAWERPSALAGYAVGELAAHVLIATARLRDVLRDDPPTGGTVVDLAGFYGPNRVDEGADRDAGLHPLIHAAAADGAQRGPEAVAAALGEVVSDLAARLPSEDPGRLVPVLNVRDGATPLHDYLRTRVVELVVHGDDLAASVGLGYDVATRVADVVLGVCLELARDRSGDLAVLRAFVRRERADADVLRVL